MKHFVDINDMGREVAILLFDNRIYEDEVNHQYIIADIFSDKEIDLEDIDLCKSLERDNGMCTIDYYEGRDVSCLIIQNIESLKCVNMKLLEEVFNKHKGSLIGVEYSANSSVVVCYDSFVKFKQNALKVLEQMKLGEFVLVSVTDATATILDMADNSRETVAKSECIVFINLGLKIWGIESSTSDVLSYFPVRVD